MLNTLSGKRFIHIKYILFHTNKNLKFVKQMYKLLLLKNNVICSTFSKNTNNFLIALGNYEQACPITAINCAIILCHCKSLSIFSVFICEKNLLQLLKKT